MKKLSIIEYIDWIRSEVADQVAWIKAKGHSDKEVSAYQAGYEHGMMKARALLELHGYLVSK